MHLPKDAWYRMLFVHSLDGIWLARPSGQLLTANPAACAILGYSADDIPQLQRQDVIAPAHLALADSLTAHSGPSPWRAALDFVRKDGSTVPVDVSSEAFSGVDDQPLHCVIFRDLSTERQATAALRESETRYRTAFMTSPDAITITDLKDGRYLDINEGFTRIFGWFRDEAIGRTSLDLRIWQDLGERDAFIRQFRLHRECLNFEARFRNRHGEPVTGLVSSRVIGFGGQSCILTVTRDVSERKRAEVELDQYRHHLEELVEDRTRELQTARDVAQTANQAKSSFLANMSHEIRTPLNAILGYARLLQRSSVSEVQREQLERVRWAGDHLLTLVNDVLDFSKIEAGELHLESIEFDAIALLDGVGALIRESASTKGLTVTVAPQDLPRSLRGDPTRLRQALLNLASNAVKFTDHGSVTLSAQTLHGDDHGLLLRFEVLDTGVGIAPAKLGELFEPFHQVDASTTRLHGGTGLGLAITRRLARLMGGDAGVESVPGQGSAFWITVRCEAGGIGTAAANAPHLPLELDAVQAQLAGKRVLVAEDNPVNQELIRALLEDVGLVVSVADDGQQAVEMAPAPVDLIFMDMQMPVMDGLAATRLIRQLSHRRGTPILAMTANAFDADRQRCLDAGMNDFLTKPIDPDQLYRLLVHWLNEPAASRRA